MAANSGSSDIVNTSTVAGRNAPELENLMGERHPLTNLASLCLPTPMYYLYWPTKLPCIILCALSPFCLNTLLFCPIWHCLLPRSAC